MSYSNAHIHCNCVNALHLIQPIEHLKCMRLGEGGGGGGGEVVQVRSSSMTLVLHFNTMHTHTHSVCIMPSHNKSKIKAL